MRRLARQAQSLVDIQALGLIYSDPWLLDEHLRRFWLYVPDPVFAEFVRDPAYQLALANNAGYYQGDCDDAATFAGAIVLASGWPCRFTAYRYLNNPEFSHVNLRCGYDGNLIDVDPTVKPEQLPITDMEKLDCVL